MCQHQLLACTSSQVAWPAARTQPRGRDFPSHPLRASRSLPSCRLIILLDVYMKAANIWEVSGNQASPVSRELLHHGSILRSAKGQFWGQVLPTHCLSALQHSRQDTTGTKHTSSPGKLLHAPSCLWADYAKVPQVCSCG